MKILLCPVLGKFMAVLVRHGVISESQHGSLHGASVGAAIFVAQCKLPGQGPCHVVSFAISKAFDSAPHGAIMCSLDHVGVPPDIRFLLLFAHRRTQVRMVTTHGLTKVVVLFRGVRQGAIESPILFNLLLEPLLRALPCCLRLDPETLLLG